MNKENLEQEEQKNCGSCVGRVEILIRAGVELPTLGGRARIRFGIDDSGGYFCLPEGGNGTPHSISRKQITAVCERYNSLKEQDVKNPVERPRYVAAGQYTLPHWGAPGPTGLIVGPFLAALVKLLDQLENV